MGIDNLHTYQQEAIRLIKKRGYIEFPVLVPRWDWRAYVAECAELATWAMTHDDRRTFVHYFSRAVWAWALKEDQDAVK